MSNKICLPTTHLGVLMNSFNVSVHFRLNWNLEELVLEER